MEDLYGISEVTENYCRCTLDVFQIITEIEDQFGIQIPDDAIENIVTVGDAATQIQNALAK